MSDQTPRSVPAPLPLPDSPNLDWLRKQAKRRLAELREANADAQLAAAIRTGQTVRVFELAGTQNAGRLADGLMDSS